jgi:hypothetical protein
MAFGLFVDILLLFWMVTVYGSASSNFAMHKQKWRIGEYNNLGQKIKVRKGHRGQKNSTHI